MDDSSVPCTILPSAKVVHILTVLRQIVIIRKIDDADRSNLLIVLIDIAKLIHGDLLGRIHLNPSVHIAVSGVICIQDIIAVLGHQIALGVDRERSVPCIFYG